MVNRSTKHEIPDSPAALDDLVARGLKTPEFLIIDGGAGLEKALAALWPEVPTQRCTVHKHRNLARSQQLCHQPPFRIN